MRNKKISIALLGNKNGRGNGGRRQSENHKKNMSKSHLGKSVSLETRLKLREYWLGRKQPKTTGKNHWNWKGGMQKKQGCGIIRPSSCEVCGNNHKICYDHDHKTGQFRGWLCNNCNVALGFAGDSIERLEKLKVYLENKKTITI